MTVGLEVFIPRIFAYFSWMMNLRFFFALVVSAGGVFAEVPEIPKEAIARKKSCFFQTTSKGGSPQAFGTRWCRHSRLRTEC